MRETQDSKESKQYTSQKRGGCEWLVRERAGYVNTTSSCHARRRSLLLHPFPKPTVGALSVPNAGGQDWGNRHQPSVRLLSGADYIIASAAAAGAAITPQAVRRAERAAEARRRRVRT